MVLYVVVPCYNEEEILEKSAQTLKKKLKILMKNNIIDKSSKILFVNDGSKDRTIGVMESLINSDDIFMAIDLKKNVGHQNALLAGLMYAKDFCDVTISIDADLQDDIDAIDLMLESYNRGNEIVYGVRKERKKDTFFKRYTAEKFYSILNKMGVNIVFNHADFRLLSKLALQDLDKYKEKKVFLRGIIPLLGFNSDMVYYNRLPRTDGESKYTISKMLDLALDGVTSLTMFPIRVITSFGLITFFVSVVSLIFYFVFSMFKGDINCNFIMFGVLIIFMSLIILSIGIVGEYVGKCLFEVKNRPRYSIKREIKNKKK